MGDMFADILMKIGAGVVGYLSQINPFIGLLAAAAFAAAIFFLKRKIKKIWRENGQSDSSDVADNLGEEQHISNNVQSGLDDFLNNKK
jgi:hypothetical protein